MVFMALFCTAIRRDSVSLLWFPIFFLAMFRSSHAQFHQFVALSIRTVVFLPISLF